MLYILYINTDHILKLCLEIQVFKQIIELINPFGKNESFCTMTR